MSCPFCPQTRGEDWSRWAEIARCAASKLGWCPSRCLWPPASLLWRRRGAGRISEAVCVCLEGVSGSAQGCFWRWFLKPGLSQHSFVESESLTPENPAITVHSVGSFGFFIFSKWRCNAAPLQGTLCGAGNVLHILKAGRMLHWLHWEKFRGCSCAGAHSTMLGPLPWVWERGNHVLALINTDLLLGSTCGEELSCNDASLCSVSSGVIPWDPRDLWARAQLMQPTYPYSGGDDRWDSTPSSLGRGMWEGWRGTICKPQ